MSLSWPNWRRKPENRRYTVRLALAMGVYLASLFAAEILIEDRGLAGPPAYALALVPGIAVASIFWIFARLVVEERDEYLRLLYVRQSMVATGLTMSIAAVWGFLELYGLGFHLEAFWWPCIWCFGLGLGAIFNKVTMGSWGQCL